MLVPKGELHIWKSSMNAREEWLSGLGVQTVAESNKILTAELSTGRANNTDSKRNQEELNKKSFEPPTKLCSNKFD